MSWAVQWMVVQCGGPSVKADSRVASMQLARNVMSLVCCLAGPLFDEVGLGVTRCKLLYRAQRWALQADMWKNS